jgi:hypothetical protein
MRLFLITFLVLFVCFVGLFSARHLGLQTQFKQYEHPFIQKHLDSPTPIVDGNSPSGFQENSLGAIQDWISHGAKFIEIDAHSTKEEGLFLIEDKYLKEVGRTEDFVNIFELKKPILKIDDILKQFPDTSFLIDIRSNALNIHHRLSAYLNDNPQFKDRVIIRSDYPVIVDTTKKLAPDWMYASGRPTMVQFNMLLSMWLEPVAKINADLIYLEPFFGSKTVFTLRAATEIHRRHKMILLGPDISRDQLQKIEHLPFNFYITTDVNTLSL